MGFSFLVLIFDDWARSQLLTYWTPAVNDGVAGVVDDAVEVDEAVVAPWGHMLPRSK